MVVAWCGCRQALYQIWLMKHLFTDIPLRLEMLDVYEISKRITTDPY